MYPKPLCENPKFIFNRAAVLPIILQHGYYIAGKWCSVAPFRIEGWKDDFPFSQFNRMLGPSMDWNWLETTFVPDLEGRPVYLFSAVPCGHCLLCNKKRSDDFATRCQMESVTSYTAPIMVTLTYNDDHLPLEVKIVRKVGPTIGYPEPREVAEWVPTRLRGLESSDDDLDFETRVALRKKDVQKFLDRLRHTWKYRNKFPISYGTALSSAQCRSENYAKEFPFRYVLVGEYGSNFGRPHYHLIMWNVPYHIKSVYDFDAIDHLKSDIVEAWQMSDFYKDNGLYKSIQIQCEVARDAGKYVGKYLGKGNKNGRKGFFSASSRHGGIGSRLIDSRTDFLRQNPHVNTIGWTDSSGRYVEYTLGRYATRRVYPSVSNQIPDVCKQFYRQFCNKATSLYRRLSLLGADKGYLRNFEISVDRCSPDPVHLPSMLSTFFKSRLLPFGRRLLSMTQEMFDDVVADTLFEVDMLFMHGNDSLQDLPKLNSCKISELDELRNTHFSYLTRPPVNDAVLHALAVHANVEDQMAVAREVF